MSASPRRTRDRLRSRLRGFPTDVSGVNAVEFALIIPVFISLLLGGVEVYRLVQTTKKTVSTANALGEMVSSTQAPLAAGDFSFVSNAGLLIAPQVLKDAQTRGTPWSTILRSSYTSVVFTPTVPGCLVLCVYTANVAWSAGPQRRACGVLQVMADGGAYDPTKLPQSVFNSGSLIVVDVQYDYRPMFASSVIGSKTITRSAYFVPRYLDPVTLGDMSANPSLATKCPGYS